MIHDIVGGMFKKPTRAVNCVHLHCTASNNPAYDTEAIRRDHIDNRGWSDGGYHYVIHFDGSLHKLRPLEKTPASAKGYNTGALAICCQGLTVDKFTEAQFRTVQRLCREIDSAYGNSMVFRGHCEMSNKTCPVYDYKSVLDLDEYGRINHTLSSADVGEMAEDAPPKPLVKSTISWAGGIAGVAAAMPAITEISDRAAGVVETWGDWIIPALAVIGIGAAIYVIYERRRRGQEYGF